MLFEVFSSNRKAVRKEKGKHPNHNFISLTNIDVETPKNSDNRTLNIETPQARKKGIYEVCSSHFIKKPVTPLTSGSEKDGEGSRRRNKGSLFCSLGNKNTGIRLFSPKRGQKPNFHPNSNKILSQFRSPSQRPNIRTIASLDAKIHPSSREKTMFSQNSDYYN